MSNISNGHHLLRTYVRCACQIRFSWILRKENLSGPSIQNPFPYYFFRMCPLLPNFWLLEVGHQQATYIITLKFVPSVLYAWGNTSGFLNTGHFLTIVWHFLMSGYPEIRLWSVLSVIFCQITSKTSFLRSVNWQVVLAIIETWKRHISRAQVYWQAVASLPLWSHLVVRCLSTSTLPSPGAQTVKFFIGVGVCS